MSGRSCSVLHRANASPSSCSTCTATTRRRPHGSWASVRRPSARSRRRAAPYSEREAQMPDLREVFEMTTKQMGEPDLDSWREQEKRQRNATRNKKLGAIAVVSTIVVAAVWIVTSGGLFDRTSRDEQRPGASATVGPSVPPTPTNAPAVEPHPARRAWGSVTTAPWVEASATPEVD